jgi:hypothetical protein
MSLPGNNSMLRFVIGMGAMPEMMAVGIFCHV